MTTYPPVLEAKSDGVQAVIDTALRSAQPARLEPGGYYTVVTPTGGVQKIDLTGPEYQDYPSRKIGTTTVRDVESFLVYFSKHADDDTEVYADVQQRTVTAVLDAHTGEDARWGGHLLKLSLRHTDAWRAWTTSDNRLMTQAQFAEFIEDNLADLVEPDSATMLELAESFQATTKAEFQSGTRLATGQRKLSYVEDVQAKAGHKGDIVIPAALKLGIRPFEGSEPYALNARFRYRLERGGELRLGFKLDRPEDVLNAAFGDIRDAVAEGIPMPVLNGSPA